MPVFALGCAEVAKEAIITIANAAASRCKNLFIFPREFGSSEKDYSKFGPKSFNYDGSTSDGGA